MSNIANFSGASNAGAQVGQNYGIVNNTVTVHNFAQPLPTGESVVEQEECHQIFRLVNNSRGDGYEWYKNRIEDRVEGTCEWFLQHENYKSWKENSSGPLLVSADPGCGKSVLAKHLIEHELPGTVCYFFFKDQDQNTVKQALCALLHQIFIREPSVIKYAMVEYKRNGKNLVNVSDALWSIFWQAALDPIIGPIIFVLDALDECTESDLRELVSQLTRHFSATETECKIRFFMTSRPYQDIISSFWKLEDTFPEIRIPGEEHSEQIATEVNHMIRYRMTEVCQRFRLKGSLRTYLEKCLLEVKHRTYLWVYLVFEHLEHGFKKTERGIKDCIETVPESVSEAYEKILTRSKSKEKVREILLIVLGATRPMTLEETNVAVNIFDGCESEQSLDLEATEDFKETLRDLCGLFISIYDNKVYFLHQTAREFLLQTSPIQGSTDSRSWHWKGSMTLLQSHSHLAEICINYLSFDVWKQKDLLAHNLDCQAECGEPEYTWEITGLLSVPERHALEVHLGLRHKFFEYSAGNWPYHYRAADVSLKQRLLSQALQACMMIGEAPPVWFLFNLLVARNSFAKPVGFCALLIASSCGLDEQVEQLLRSQHPNFADRGGETALHYVQHVSTARILLQHGADIHSKCHLGRTPLWRAVQNRNTAVVQFFIDEKAQVNECDSHGFAPLRIACERDDENITRALLAAGADVNAKDSKGRTALFLAAANSSEACARLLLDAGANINEEDLGGDTPLMKAVTEGHSEGHSVVQLLLHRGADVDARNRHGYSALSIALHTEEFRIVASILDRGPNLDFKDPEGYTPLHITTTITDEATQLLLERNLPLDVNALNDWRRTPLHLAAARGLVGSTRMLLERGAEVNPLDCYGKTPLDLANRKGADRVAQLLLERGAQTS